MEAKIAEHLPKAKRIQQGSYYTPEKLVNRVHQLIEPYQRVHTQNAVVLDSAGGYGAFFADIKNTDYRIAEYDEDAYKILAGRFDRKRIFLINSLIAPSRAKYSIAADAYLIIIGNPPYNDITSEFKKGEKGENRSDPELFDRDLGISFLKSYEKLSADVVCILHPLAYLVKEANFNRLREFRNNYRLIKAEIFSSEYFFGTGITKFPIIIALYEKDPAGMTYGHIFNFPFDMLDSGQKFVLANYSTTDGYIDKYPPGKKVARLSPIGLYYYTFRDFNSLKRNASFINKSIPNAIVVTAENFYKYAYLYALKTLFNPDQAWLYGNLSPLKLGDIERDKNLYVSYALQGHKIFGILDRSSIGQLLDHYGVTIEGAMDLKTLETEINERFMKAFLEQTSGACRSVAWQTTQRDRAASYGKKKSIQITKGQQFTLSLNDD